MFLYLYQTTRKSTGTLMKEMKPLVFEKSRFAFQVKSDHFHFFGYIGPKNCKAMTLSRNIVIEEWSADRQKKIKSVCQDGSYKFSIIDNFHVSSFRSEEPSTKEDSQVVFCHKKNIDWDIGWRTAAGSFCEI